MKRQASTRAIFLAGMVFASSAFAVGTDIKKCVTEAGHVTLTDALCPGDSQAVKIISAPDEAEPQRQAATQSRAIATERFAATRLPARYATLIKSTTPARSLSLDMSTLRAARANMQLFDNASQTLRSQRLAGLQ
ncbi:DUF4124 domain-containing protein [Massilia sp. TSP1-1-2]|uniref:DUF4124 domain-containing protein n=1 Tax=unclassified Massilia TaxID=2609279 RepID=UPI003CF1267C